MTESVIAAIVTGGLSLLGVVISNRTTVTKTAEGLRMAQAVIDNKLETLTLEVREHNNFARRMPVVEEQIKEMNHRICGLENAQR